MAQAYPSLLQALWAAFSFLYFKKIKFQKYMPNKEIFKNGCLSPPYWVSVAHPVGDRTLM